MRNRFSSEQPNDAKDWINLRDAAGNLQARYHPKLRLLLIQERRTKTLHDLSRFDSGAPPCQDTKTVL